MFNRQTFENQPNKLPREKQGVWFPQSGAVLLCDSFPTLSAPSQSTVSSSLLSFGDRLQIVFYPSDSVCMVFKHGLNFFCKKTTDNFTDSVFSYKNIPKIVVKSNNTGFTNIRIKGVSEAVEKAAKVKENFHTNFSIYYSNDVIFVGKLDKDQKPAGEGFSYSVCGYFEFYSELPNGDIQVECFNLNNKCVWKRWTLKKDQLEVKEKCRMRDLEGTKFEAEANFEKGRMSLWSKNRSVSIQGSLAENVILNDEGAPVKVNFPNGEKSVANLSSGGGNQPKYYEVLGNL